MARIICVQPCAPNASMSVHLPFMGDMAAQAGLSLEGGCAGCDIVSNLLIQIGPALGSMGIPICILGCLSAVLGVVAGLAAAFDIPPDPTAVLDALEAIPEKCKCVLQFALPFPAGAVCEMLKTVYGVIQVINIAVTCVGGLLGDVITINVRATGLQTSSVLASQLAGACVSAQVQAMTNALNQKFGTISGLFSLLDPILSLISVPLQVVPAVGEALTTLSAAIHGFAVGVPTGTPPDEFLHALLELETVLGEVLGILRPIVGICP